MEQSDRKAAIIASSLWAAAGDALGWITELGDEGTVRHRTGDVTVDEPVDWRRRIGGRFGPTVKLKAGTYSDDTQLRLAVSRAIRGNGDFDVEAFAKVELPVWQSYSLGAGRGSSAAATNLAKSNVNWFNNFFGGSDGRNYFSAGGNGAAMRIQPHVWKSDPLKPETFLTEVIRDAVSTHGHPTGFCGAVFHALCVAFALGQQKVPSPRDWQHFAETLEYCTSIIRSDEKLGLFWRAAWEDKTNTRLEVAVQSEMLLAIDLIKGVSRLTQRKADYTEILQSLGGFDPERRGAGLHTAIAAAVLSSYSEFMSNEDVIRMGANTIGSDTDTISSMAGAIIGAARPQPLTWKIQDSSYLVKEAERLFAIAHGEITESFIYPDLLSWSPPSNQSNAIGIYEGRFAIAGLGYVENFGEAWETSEAIWQWARTQVGQTLLVKRRPTPRKLSAKDMPNELRVNRPRSSPVQPELFSSNIRDKINDATERRRIRSGDVSYSEMDLDTLSDYVIDRNFDAKTIGEILLNLSVREQGIELAARFSAIIAKAARVRTRRAVRG